MIYGISYDEARPDMTETEQDEAWERAIEETLAEVMCEEYEAAHAEEWDNEGRAA